MRPVATLLSLSLIGCSPLLSNAGQSVATGAVNGLTSPASRDKLTSEETKLIAAARGEALSPATQEKLQALLVALSSDLRTELTTTRDVLLGDRKLVQELAALRETLLGAGARDDLDALVRSAVDEALSLKTGRELGELIDSASPHLGAAVDRLVTELTPRLQAAVQATSTTAERDLASLRGYFVWAAIGLGVLLTLVLTIIVALTVMYREHRKLSRRITKNGG
jgi:hypothetical protein